MIAKPAGDYLAARSRGTLYPHDNEEERKMLRMKGMWPITPKRQEDD